MRDSLRRQMRALVPEKTLHKYQKAFLSYGLFTSPDTDSYTDLDSDSILCRNCSHCTDSDSNLDLDLNHYWTHFCRPQRSWAKVMFLQVCVILFTGGVSASVHAGIPHPPGADTPWEQTPHWSRHPPRTKYTPPGLSTPPGTKYTPHGTKYTPMGLSTIPPEADSGIRSTSGRYASYWNAFLLEQMSVPGAESESLSNSVNTPLVVTT